MNNSNVSSENPRAGSNEDPGSLERRIIKAKRRNPSIRSDPKTKTKTNSNNKSNPGEPKAIGKEAGEIFPEDIQRRSSKAASIATTGSSGTRNVSVLGDDASLWDRYLHKDPYRTGLSILGYVVGVALAMTLKKTKPACYWTPRKTDYVGFVGKIFANIISCIRTPLILTSIIASVGSMDFRTFAFIGRRGFAYVFLILAVGSTLGCITGVVAMTQENRYKDDCNVTGICGTVCPFWAVRLHPTPFRCEVRYDLILNIIRTMLPENLFEAFVRTEKAGVDFESPDPQISNFQSKDCQDYLQKFATTSVSPKPGADQFGILRKKVDATNALGIIVIGIFIGVCTMWIGEPAHAFLNLCISCSEVCLKLATWTLWLAPFAITSLEAESILKRNIVQDHSSFLQYLYWSMIVCQFFATYLLLPFIYFVVVRKSPHRIYRSLLPVMALAFGTSSSASALPMTINALEELSHLDPRIVRLFLPIGTIMNMPGSAAIHAAFGTVAFMKNGGIMDFNNFFKIVLVATTTTFSLPTDISPIPGTESVTTILGALETDSEAATHIISLIPILDPLATVGNVAADCIGAAIFHQWCKKHLHHLQREEEKIMKEAELDYKNKAWDQIAVQPTAEVPLSEESLLLTEGASAGGI